MNIIPQRSRIDNAELEVLKESPAAWPVGLVLLCVVIQARRLKGGSAMKWRWSASHDPSSAELMAPTAPLHASHVDQWLDDEFRSALRRWAATTPVTVGGVLAAFRVADADQTGVFITVVVLLGAVLHASAVRFPSFLASAALTPSYLLFALGTGLTPLLAMPTTSNGQAMLLLYSAVAIPMTAAIFTARRKLGFVFMCVLGASTLGSWAGQGNTFDAWFPEISIGVITALALAVFDDNSERHRRLAEHRLASLQISEIDPLTGLYRRASFLERVEESDVLHASGGSLFFIDIDRFKVINDTLGHKAGDELLNATAARIRGVLKAGDVAGRIGGDEFAVFSTGMSRDDAKGMATRLAALFEHDFELGGTGVPVAASLGVACVDDEPVSAPNLMHLADIAMYAAKREGRSVRFFDERMRAELMVLEATELDLRASIRDDEIRAFFQPITDALSDHIVGFEALGRWQRDGLIVPAREFFPSARQSNLLPDITRAVARDVADFMALLPDGQAPLVGVNVEAPDLGSFLAWFEQQDIDATRWVVEITEGQLLLDHRVEAAARLRHAAAMGFGIMLDDFGTGHSSLTRILYLPIDGLKIDKSFVGELETNDTARAIVSSVAHLGKACDLVVIAEGVETESQREILLDLGVHLMQGFHFHRPLEMIDALGLLNSHEAAAADIAKQSRRNRLGLR